MSLNRLRSKISVTELSEFQKCRRRWYFGKILGLEPKAPVFNFWFGKGIHAALEAYYDNYSASPENRLETSLEAYSIWYNEQEAGLVEAYGQLWDNAKEIYYESSLIALDMIRNYHKMTLDNGDFDEPSAVEQKIRVPIIGASGNPTPVLVAIFDLETITGQIIDHKTAMQKPRVTVALDLDEQLTGYAYVYYRVHGSLPREIIYNALVKEVPQSPNVLQSGKLSLDKRQKTTHEIYLKTIQERGENPNRYLEILDVLRSKGWSEFFDRQITRRNEAQIKSFESRLAIIYGQMLEAAEDPLYAYPNPSPMNCPSCPFLDVCVATERGEDADGLIDARYHSRSRDEVIERVKTPVGSIN